MDYFKILNLSREPFSNSPEPELFFLSTGHLACLQQLELAIRLRRGLNVVMGEVGTGKTTLCRELIQRLAESEEDQEEIETHLLLDPSFSTPREFLVTVAALFGLSGAGERGTESEWQIKERVKNHLFQKGMEEGKTVLLIIDEGQKLPDFGREILREFLNYETNENKLLQIVIFAQNEFREILKGHHNFADRVNRCCLLGPLDFSGTRAMIRFRLAKAGRPADGPKLFTLPALWAVYRATGGYPRKIITLCHQIVLAMIIQNRVRADWKLVRATSRRVMPVMVAKLRWTTAILAALFLLTAIAYPFFVPEPLNILPNRISPPQKAAVPVVLAPSAHPTAPTKAAPPAGPPPAGAAAERLALSPAASTRSAEDRTVVSPAASTRPDADPGQRKGGSVEAAQDQKPPDQLGRLRIREGGTITYLLQEIYGDIRSAPSQSFIRANPHIADMNWVRAGETINFPAIPTSSPFLGPEKIWVQVAKKSDLEEAHRFYKEYPAELSPIRLIPYWSRKEGMVFVIFLKRPFFSEAEAREAIRDLPPAVAARAEIMRKPDKGAVFFAN